MTADLQVLDAEVVPTFEEATARAENIQRGVEDFFTITIPTIQTAWQLRDWEVLGFDSWDSYVESVVKGAVPKMAKEIRGKIVVQLTELGMSTRAIASVVGANKSTVQRDQIESGATAPNETVGVNGKEYTRKFTCSQCGKRKSYDTRVEIEEGKWACEACADDYVASQPDPDPAPVTRTPKETAHQRKITRLQTQLSVMSAEIPWSNSTAIKLFALAREIEELMEQDVE